MMLATSREIPRHAAAPTCFTSDTTRHRLLAASCIDPSCLSLWFKDTVWYAGRRACNHYHLPACASAWLQMTTQTDYQADQLPPIRFQLLASKERRHFIVIRSVGIRAGFQQSSYTGRVSAPCGKVEKCASVEIFGVCRCPATEQCNKHPCIPVEAGVVPWGPGVIVRLICPSPVQMRGRVA
jgi:hypothetical protein